jgi:hypothetical protein
MLMRSKGTVIALDGNIGVCLKDCFDAEKR